MDKQHPNIKFTFQKQQKKSNFFLDTLIKNNGENVSATIFRKKAIIGFCTNSLSFTQLSYKIVLAKTLVHRDFKICSNWCLFDDEVNNIKKYLEKNSYSKGFIERKIKTYLEKQFNIEPTKASNSAKLNYYKLPYIENF